ncbi:heme biosynthesis HemY N-terminal domain-containing protein [Reinekea thalattae]|uniref:HemY N-terminal domain-containing protein n=1 Tax=Reinekea thalattae TaxID=2593301 RepID=A0A5C8Z3Y0_9GAMM|nr:heme biosynthesis HemY N-terminal domain-containing protein [Reinekea thalattae]TXR51881.1 hypothetical protein FME95_10660 [Reinekea thalattae]
MKKLAPLLLLFIVVLLLGGVLAQMMSKDAGVMLLSWNGWLVETTFWVGVALIISFLLTLYFGIWLLQRIAPTRWLGQLQLRRRRRQARIETKQAIDRWMLGDEEGASQALQKVAKAGGSERLPRALSLALGVTHAQWPDQFTAFTQQDAELTDYALMLQAERYWQLDQPLAFIALLKDHPTLAALPRLQRRYWQALIENSQASDAIAHIIGAHSVQPDERQRWLVQAVVMAFKQVLGEPQQSQKILKPLNKAQKALPEICVAEIQYLISIGEHSAAFKRIKQLLLQPHQLDQCELLLALNIDDKLKLDYLHSLKPAEPSATYCRVVGLLHFNLKIWGSAQSWLELAWQQQDLVAAVQLAELYQQRDMEKEAASLYQAIAHSIHQPNQKED